MTETNRTSETNQEIQTRAVLVGMITREISEEEAEKGLNELERLLDTAGGVCVARVLQSKDTPDPATAIGSGKVREIRELCENLDADLAVFDFELSPSQIRNLEDGIGTQTHEVRVIDRSMLILDIFALHAVTGEGKLQVELAQLKYTAPRLSGHGKEMSRLGGGIGTRGPGESKLESDRRHMQRRITALESELAVMEKNRRTMRASRDRSGLKKVAIVGYTNAGKSTLLNRLTDAGILAEDKLFATLDPTTRKFRLPGGESILLTDTVGFIRKLPHHLVKAFRSTLDEAVYADMIIVLIDASDPECGEQLKVTENLLAELGAADKPVLYVYNKCDRGVAHRPAIGKSAEQAHIAYISALTGQGCEAMAETVEEMLHADQRRVTFRIPNAEQSALHTLYRDATVESVEYGDDCVTAVAVVDRKTHGQLERYALEKLPVREE